ncbi:MAG: cobalamin-dependent protein, partial [Limisphaerales bacterium]
MAEIVLTTLNAKYIHAAFGLRYLFANLGALRSQACIREFEISQRPVDVAEAVLAENPKIVGCGVYIWNTTQLGEVISAIKKVRPDVIVIVGGPEVSFEIEEQPVARLADYVITGEADLKFAEICGRILEGDKPPERTIAAALPEFSKIEL